jgi:predicted lipoprotein with Yx(FWY)xxD motif
MRRAVAAASIVGVIAVATAAAQPERSGNVERRAAGTTVKTVFNAKLKSTILVTGKGLTLYYWTHDSGRTSNCVNDALYHCSKWWPPLLTTGTPVATGGAKQSLLGTTKRAGGKTQVTYAGHPVYRWVGVGSPAPDTKPGDVYGQGFISQWWALSPSGKAIKKLAK